MKWPFKEWGASIVLSGHEHTLERLVIDDLTYIVNGLGGKNLIEKIIKKIKKFPRNFPEISMIFSDDCVKVTIGYMI